jgi:hypothetical protein
MNILLLGTGVSLKSVKILKCYRMRLGNKLFGKIGRLEKRNMEAWTTADKTRDRMG